MEQQDITTLDEAIVLRLASTVKTKTGQAVVDPDTGEPVTPTVAMAMSLISNAMKGDVSSMLFVRNVMRSAGSGDAAEARARYEAELEAAVAAIRGELEAEGLWVGQSLEVEQLARKKLRIGRLCELTAAADYEEVITETGKNGSATLRLNPLGEQLNRLQNEYLKDLGAIRTDALRRKVNAKAFRRN